MNTLKFKWTVSRGQETYGYNICSLWIDRQKVSSCNGGGYDMRGTALAIWVKQEFYDKLKKLKTPEFYGLSFYNKKRHKSQKTWSKDCTIGLDGACGFECIVKILRRFGHTLTYVDGGVNHSTYILQAK